METEVWACSGNSLDGVEIRPGVVEWWAGNLGGDHVVNYPECQSEVFLIFIH